MRDPPFGRLKSLQRSVAQGEVFGALRLLPIRQAKIQAARKIKQSGRATAPHRVMEEVTPLPTIPAKNKSTFTAKT
jgi:hypothetical protein